MSDVILPYTIATGQQRSAAKVQANDEALRDYLNGEVTDRLDLTIPTVAAEPALRMIRGRVNSNGTLAQGSGFTCAKTATGRYTITFSTAFSAEPIVVITSMGNEVAAHVSPSPTVGGVIYRTFTSTTSADADAPGHFIAIGPV